MSRWGKKRGRELLFKFVLALFILCLFALFVLGIFIRHLLVPRRAFFFFFFFSPHDFCPATRRLLKHFHPTFFFFFFVSMGIQKGLTMSQRLRPTELVENTAGLFFFFLLLFTLCSLRFLLNSASPLRLFMVLQIFSLSSPSAPFLFFCPPLFSPLWFWPRPFCSPPFFLCCRLCVKRCW